MKNELIKLFIKLVMIDSPTGKENKIMDFIDKFISQTGFKCIKDTFGNRIIKIKGTGLPLLLSAHTDTVEPGHGVKPEIKNGLIKSDGSTILGADNKAGMAVILNLLREISVNKIKVRPLEIIFTRSEESGNLGAVNLDYTQLISKEGYIFDNSNLVGSVIYASPYYYRFDVMLKGKSAHASRPDKAVNILPVLSLVLQKVRLGYISDNTIANIGVVKAGEVRNSIPGACVISGEVRSYIKSEAIACLKRIKDIIRNEAERNKCTVKFTSECENAGYILPKDDPFILKTRQMIKNAGLKTKLIKSLGCSDANIFNTMGIKVLDLGDGSHSAHTTDESIATTDLFRLYNLLKHLVTI